MTPSFSISVVIPTYNRLDLLPAAIASALAQTLPVIEIIVADDGSTDGTIDWVEDYARGEPRLRLVRCAHGGANRARNSGVEIATGDWVAFLDSDDQWEPHKLERQVDLLMNNPEAVAVFTGMRIDTASNDQRVFIPRRVPSLLDLRCSNALSSTSTALVKTDVLRAVGSFDPELPSCQDWDLWFRLRQRGPFELVRESLVIINAGTHDRITTNPKSVRDGHRVIFERLRRDVDNSSELRRIDAGHLLVIADLENRAGLHGDALRKAFKALIRAPSIWALRSTGRAFAGSLRRAFRSAGAEVPQN